jgi:lysophospholipase L1-like esterase
MTRLFSPRSWSVVLIVALVVIFAPRLPAAAVTTQEPAPLRLAFLGDSLTLGLHASAADKTYRELLRRRIFAGHPQGVAHSIYQDPFGLTDEALRRVPDVLEPSPDIIIVEIGNHEVFAGGDEIARFSDRYDELLDRLTASGAVVIAGTVAWLNYPADSRAFADALRVNAIIGSVCARYGVAVADLWTATVFRPDLISQPGDVSFIDPFTGDTLHPNDAGHRALADAFWDAYQRDRARRALAALR